MNHDFRTRNNFRRWSLLVALAFVSVGAQAQTAVYDRFTTSSGIEVGTGPGYVPKTVDQARGQAIWDKAVNSNGGMPSIGGDHVARNPSGNPVPVKATASIPAVEVSKAVGRGLGRLAVKVAFPIAVGVELYELAKEVGHIIKRNPDGSIGYEKPDPSVCTVAPCSEYAFRTGPNGSSSATGFYPTAEAACLQSLSITQAANPGITFTYVSATSGACNYRTSAGGSQVFTYTGTTRTASPLPAAYVPGSQQELLDAVAAKSGWPSTSAINKVIKDDLESGGLVKTGPISVSGPASSAGTSRTTNNTTNNTTRTDTTTHNHSYAGNTVTTTNVYNSVVINNTTGDTISNETTTETGKAEPAKEDQCATYPDSLGCSELGDQEETPMPTKTENVTFTPVAFQSNATCPAPLSITGTLPISGSFNYSLSYSGVCDGAGIVRLFLLAGAALVGVGIFVGGLKT